MNFKSKARPWWAQRLSQALLFLALLAQLGSARAEGMVVFSGWGGSIQQAQRKIIFNEFEKETGIKVIDVAGADLSKLKAMVESGNVEWDVTQALGMWIPLGAKQNLWESLDYNVIGAADIPAAFRKEYGVGNSMYGNLLAYNEEMLKGKKAPASWKDFWNVQEWPGRRSLFSSPRYILEFALLADGVSPDKLYPLDVDRAFRKLDEIKPNISVWYQQAAQLPAMLSSEEIIMGNAAHTRITSVVRDEKVPLKMVWQNALITVDYLAIPRGSKNKQNAMKLIGFMSRPDIQEKFAAATDIGPTNTKALALLSDDQKLSLPSFYRAQGMTIDFNDDWWAERFESLTQRWNAWLLAK